MLKADAGRVALQVDINPAALLVAVSALQARIVGSGAFAIRIQRGLQIVVRVGLIVIRTAGHPQKSRAEQKDAESDNATNSIRHEGFLLGFPAPNSQS